VSAGLFLNPSVQEQEKVLPQIQDSIKLDFSGLNLKGITMIGGTITEQLTKGETKIINFRVGAFYAEPAELIFTSDSELITLPDSQTFDKEWYDIPILIKIPNDFESGEYEIMLSVTKKGNPNEVAQFNTVMNKKLDLIIT